MPYIWILVIILGNGKEIEVTDLTEIECDIMAETSVAILRESGIESFEVYCDLNGVYKGE